MIALKSPASPVSQQQRSQHRPACLIQVSQHFVLTAGERSLQKWAVDVRVTGPWLQVLCQSPLCQCATHSVLGCRFGFNTADDLVLFDGELFLTCTPHSTLPPCFGLHPQAARSACRQFLHGRWHGLADLAAMCDPYHQHHSRTLSKQG